MKMVMVTCAITVQVHDGTVLNREVIHITTNTIPKDGT